MATASEVNKGKRYAAKPMEIKRRKLEVWCSPCVIEMLNVLKLGDETLNPSLRGKGEIFDKIILDYARARMPKTKFEGIVAKFKMASKRFNDAKDERAMARRAKWNAYQRAYRAKKKLEERGQA